MLGTDIYTTSKLLGHNHVATTEIYAKVIDKKKVESMTNLDMDWLDTYYIYMKEERNVSKAVYDHLHLLRPILDSGNNGGVSATFRCRVQCSNKSKR